MPTSRPVHRFSLDFLPSALAEWKALDGSVRAQFKSILAKRLQEPRLPGSQLHGELSDCYKIKLRRSGYRLIYRVQNERLVVTVIAVGKRERDAVYVAARTRK